MDNPKSGFPARPYLNEVKQDGSVMHYVNDGAFGHSEIGATSQGMEKTVNDVRMSIKHVGDKK